MRKQELVHLHALCVLVRAQVEAREAVPPDAFASYDELGVTASAVYRSKRAHRRAVRCLASDVADVVDDESAPADLTTADGTHHGSEHGF